MKADMRKVRPLHGRGSEEGPWVIAEAVHQRDADRVLAEPWPFTWTPPSSPNVAPWWCAPGDIESWKTYHRDMVIRP